MSLKEDLKNVPLIIKIYNATVNFFVVLFLLSYAVAHSDSLFNLLDLIELPPIYTTLFCPEFIIRGEPCPTSVGYLLEKLSIYWFFIFYYFFFLRALRFYYHRFHFHHLLPLFFLFSLFFFFIYPHYFCY
jgi:hypothetical protein